MTAGAGGRQGAWVLVLVGLGWILLSYLAALWATKYRLAEKVEADKSGTRWRRARVALYRRADAATVRRQIRAAKLFGIACGGAVALTGIVLWIS